eukprot:scpid101193/ scgid31976/ 
MHRKPLPTTPYILLCYVSNLVYNHRALQTECHTYMMASSRQQSKQIKKRLPDSRPKSDRRTSSSFWLAPCRIQQCCVCCASYNEAQRINSVHMALTGATQRADSVTRHMECSSGQ